MRNNSEVFENFVKESSTSVLSTRSVLPLLLQRNQSFDTVERTMMMKMVKMTPARIVIRASGFTDFKQYLTLIIKKM